MEEEQGQMRGKGAERDGREEEGGERVQSSSDGGVLSMVHEM